MSWRAGQPAGWRAGGLAGQLAGWYSNHRKSKLQKRKILKYKKYLAKTKSSFYTFNEFLFVFQTYNKGLFTKKILNPFLEMKVKNILVFAVVFNDFDPKVNQQ